MFNSDNDFQKERRFFWMLIKKFPELEDFLTLITSWSIYQEIRKIISEKKNEEIKEFDNNFMMLLDEQQSLIYYHFNISWREQRISNFYYLLKEFINVLYNGKNEEYSENKYILDEAYKTYFQNNDIKLDNVQIFEKMIHDTQCINFNKFKVLEAYWCSTVKDMTVIWGRYWVGKTICSQWVIEDAINSNNNIKILYFGTSEVDKQSFIKRFMTMRSSYPINELISKRERLSKRKQELWDILNILEYNISWSITFLQKWLSIDKYYDMNEEYLSNTNRINNLQNEILQLKLEQESPFIQKKIEDKQTEVQSLQLKNKEKYKNFSNFIKLDSEYLTIIEEIYTWLVEDILEFNKENEWSKKTIELTLWTFQEIKKQQDEMKKDDYKEVDLNEIVNAFWKINNFLKIISENKFSKFFGKEELKNTIKERYTEYLNQTDQEINDLSKILKDEFDRIILFLQKENVEIYDKLQLTFIENKVRATRQRFPDSKILFIVDYHQKVDCWVSEIYKQSEIVWQRILDLCSSTLSYWIIFSQLKDMFDPKAKWTQSVKWLWYRPQKADFRWWEGIIINAWSSWVIFNRDCFALPDWVNEDSIDKNFPIYEIYLTKNRYWPDTYSKTKQYFILDKRKISYLAINRKWYKLLNDNKDILFLDQLIEKIKETSPQYSEIDISEIIE